jgi:DNA-binding transcriptional LysR family regulator
VLEIKDLETFVHVVENSSLTVTSEKLGIGQSTVTKRINNLEQKVKGRLFKRNSRPLQLTHLGEKVYFRGRYILEQIAQLESFHEHDDHSLQEPPQIGLPLTLMDDLAAYISDRYHADHYQNDINLHTGWGRSLIQQVIEKELRLAIVMIPSNLNLPEHVHFLKVGTLPFVIVSTNHGVKEHFNIEECSQTGWVVHPEGCCFRESLTQSLRACNLDLYVNKEVFGIELQMSCIQNGEGLGVFPGPFFEKYAKLNSNLQILDIKDFSTDLRVGIVYTDIRYIDEVNYFAQIIEERYFKT